MELNQVLEKALEESVNELDSALQALRLDDNAKFINPNCSTAAETVCVTRSGADWVELFVKEITCATSLDNVKSGVANVLESFEKSRDVEKEKVYMRENEILKRAVAILHVRQKEYEKKQEDYDQLKQLVVQYQEKIKNLEWSNYAMMMHLREAQSNNTIPIGCFQPDVF